MFAERVLSGMRPTGALHLGHYHGVLKNWVKLQGEYPCLFFVADWHALTTNYDNPQGIEQASWDMVVKMVVPTCGRRDSTGAGNCGMATHTNKGATEREGAHSGTAGAHRNASARRASRRNGREPSPPRTAE